MAEERAIAVRHSPSALYNNLTTSFDGFFAYGYREDVVVLRASGPSKMTQPAAHMSPITSIKGDVCFSRHVFIFTNRVSVSIYDTERDTRIFHTELDPSSGEPRCALIFHSPSGPVYAMVGMSAGDVFMCEINPADFALASLMKLSNHTGSIVTALATCAPDTGVGLVSGDSDGRVVFSNAALARYAEHVSPRDAVTGLVSFGGYACASYGSGQIRLFALQTGELRVAIAAHCRWINALAYNALTNRLASVGDDGVLSVWNMPTATHGQVTLHRHFVAPNKLHVGTAFGPQGTTVAVASYDVDSLLVYSL